MLKQINYLKDAFNHYKIEFEGTPSQKIYLNEIFLFYLKECVELSNKVIELIEINNNAILPLPTNVLINDINYGFDNVPKNEPGFTLKQELQLNASFRLGYIDGLKINYENLKRETCKKLWSEIEQMDLTKFVSVAKDFKVLNVLYPKHKNHDINKILDFIKVKEEELILLNAIATKTTPEATDNNIENFVNKLFLKFKIDSDLVPDFIKVLNKEAIKKPINWKKYKTTILINVFTCFKFENTEKTITDNFDINSKTKSLRTQISRINTGEIDIKSTLEYKIFNFFYPKEQQTTTNNLNIKAIKN